MQNSEFTLFLCGDVMLGRAIDQILPNPSDPVLHEDYIKNALGYLHLAENVNGPIRKPVDYRYVWGDALKEFDKYKPIAKIINLETAVTKSNDWANFKGIHYRMNPDNIEILRTAKIDCCVLANNHVLDWGEAGLTETLKTLQKAGIQSAGAGLNFQEASKPAIMQLNDMDATQVTQNLPRLLVFGFGMENSGIPEFWSGDAFRPGVNFITDFLENSFQKIKATIAAHRKPRDYVIFSVHWGGNWGYQIPSNHQRFARRLIAEAGVDLVHGHSSHHPMGIEVYQNKLILYGAGDCINDYEGIGSHQLFRGELSLLYFPSVNPNTHELTSLIMVPMEIMHFRLNQAVTKDIEWMRDMLNREGRGLGTTVVKHNENALKLEWQHD